MQTKDGFLSPLGQIRKALVKNLEVADFTAQMDFVLDANGNVNAGFQIRNQYLYAGIDDAEGYAVYVERVYNASNAPRIDICVHKFGRKSETENTYYWLGEMARTVDEGANALLAGKGIGAGTKLRLVVNVIGSRLHAYIVDPADESNVSAALNLDLKKTLGDGKDPLNGYWDKGGLAIVANSQTTDNILSNVQVNTLESVEEGVFSKLDDFYLYREVAERLVEKNGKIVAPGGAAQKLAVKHMYLQDFKASVEMYPDENGVINGGILFHATDLTRYAGVFNGYGIYVQQLEGYNNRIDLALYKYGDNGSGEVNWIGHVPLSGKTVDRYVNEGASAITMGAKKGAGYLLEIAVKGEILTATLKQIDSGAKTGTVTWDLSEPAGTADKLGKTFTEGEIGVIIESGAFSNLKVGEKETPPDTGDSFSAFAIILFLLSGALLILSKYHNSRRIKI